MKYAFIYNNEQFSDYFDSFGAAYEFAKNFDDGKLFYYNPDLKDWDGSEFYTSAKNIDGDYIICEIKRYNDDLTEFEERSIFDWVDNEESDLL